VDFLLFLSVYDCLKQYSTSTATQRNETQTLSLSPSLSSVNNLSLSLLYRFPRTFSSTSIQASTLFIANHIYAVFFILHLLPMVPFSFFSLFFHLSCWLLMLI
jgi:hypothetical protein